MIPPATVQATAATMADQDFEIDDEAEDEVDEQMDEIDNPDNAFDEDALNEGGEADPTAFGDALLASPPNQLTYTLEGADVEQLLSDDNSIMEDDNSDLPELEEVSVEGQIDQSTAEGNE